MIRIAQLRPGKGILILILCSRSCSQYSGHWSTICEFPLGEQHPLPGLILIAGKTNKATLEIVDTRLVVHNNSQVITISWENSRWTCPQMNVLLAINEEGVLPSPADTG